MRIACVSKDQRDAEAGLAVASKFLERGCTVELILDSRGTAWAAFQTDQAFQEKCAGMLVVGTTSTNVPPARAADAFLITLSASGAPNLELDFCLLGTDVPKYGIEEMIDGRHNPGWGDRNPSPLKNLVCLFVAVPTNKGYPACPVVVVGPPQLEQFRGIKVQSLRAAAHANLELPLGTPLVYYIGQPSTANPHVLSRLAEAIHRLRLLVPEVALVVSRHRADRDIPDNGATHRHVLCHLQATSGTRIFENSWYHDDLPVEHPDAIPPEFRPTELSSYRELMCACWGGGVIVTGVATDGVIVAPYLGIPLVLYRDEVQFLSSGPREKRMSRLTLSYTIPQVGSVDELFQSLLYFLGPTEDRRRRYCEDLLWTFPFPGKDPAEAIVERVLNDYAAKSVPSAT